MHWIRRALVAALTPEAPKKNTAFIPAEPGSLTSHEIVLDLMRGCLDVQDDHLKRLDSKANFNLTAATVLAAGFTTYAAGLIPKKIDNYCSPEGFAVGFSLLLFLAIIFVVWKAHRIRDFDHPPSAEGLIEYVLCEPETTRFDIANYTREAIKENESVILEKVRWVSRAELLLLVEAAWITLIVLWQVST